MNPNPFMLCIPAAASHFPQEALSLELYIQIGSNTNGGIPGQLSGSQKQRENYFSAATLVANLGPGFDGFITYDAEEDGNPITGFGPQGVEIFASGMRNPFGIVYHSNGNLYGTDNGPNLQYGDMATGCGPGEQIPDVKDVDEINLIVRDGFYGHPNHKRGETDPRQCVWRGTTVASDAEYTAPIKTMQSSSNGIIEFESNHFNGQMRGDLIVSKYKDGLYRIILSADGTSVSASSKKAIVLGGDNTLTLTQV